MAAVTSCENALYRLEGNHGGMQRGNLWSRATHLHELFLTSSLKLRANGRSNSHRWELLANNVPSVCTGLYSSHVFITHPPRVFLPQMTWVSITEPGSYYVKYFYLTLKWSKILRGNQSDKSSLPRLSLQILFMYFSVWNMKIFSLFKNHLQWALLTLLVCLRRERLYWSEFCWSLQKCDTFTPKATVIVGSRNETCKASFLLGNVLISIW